MTGLWKTCEDCKGQHREYPCPSCGGFGVQARDTSKDPLVGFKPTVERDGKGVADVR